MELAYKAWGRPEARRQKLDLNQSLAGSFFSFSVWDTAVMDKASHGGFRQTTCLAVPLFPIHKSISGDWGGRRSLVCSGSLLPCVLQRVGQGTECF